MVFLTKEYDIQICIYIYEIKITLVWMKMPCCFITTIQISNRKAIKLANNYLLTPKTILQDLSINDIINLYSKHVCVNKHDFFFFKEYNFSIN